MATETSPRTIRLLTAVLLVFTFGAGTVTGAGLSRWAVSGYGHPDAGRSHQGHLGPLPPPPLFLSPELLDQLGLSGEQREKAILIVERRRPELEAVLRETFPRVRAINQQMEEELRTILTPDQRTRLDQFDAMRPGAIPGGLPPGRGGPPLPPLNWEMRPPLPGAPGREPLGPPQPRPGQE